MRLTEHPARELHRGAKFTFFLDGEAVEAYEGETIAAALYADGVLMLGTSYKHQRSRGLYSFDLPVYMTVDGTANVNACVTLARPDMKVERQHGRGVISYD